MEPTQPARGSDLGQLVLRIQAGDGAAEAELVERFRRGLALMLRRLAGRVDLAEDLAQKTLLLVLEKVRRREVAEPERLAGFIHSTARNLLIADRRKETRYWTAGEDILPIHDQVAGRSSEAEPAQLREALREEEARLVRQVLGELPVARDRQLLLRFYLSGEAKEAICADLGIDPDRFHRVLHRARERLRDLWERAEKRHRLTRYLA